MGFWQALGFLTVIPLPRHLQERAGQEEMGRSLVYFPLVGLLLGLLLWGVDSLLRLALPVPVVSAVILALLAGLTGALHLDGFMDTCDGLGGRTPQGRLEIMRDSRVGAFGVIGVVLLSLVKYGALASLTGGWRLGALALMPVLGRWAMILAITAYPYARVEGLGKAFKQQANWPAFWWLSIFMLVLVGVFFRWAGLAAFVGVGLAVWGVSKFLQGKFGGLTGDSYGALCELGEATTLLLILPWQR